ncbi:MULTISPECIES: DNA replication/repair protein RecF [unclassified Butyrivibrio]|jgi:DNA replication and repair protein RecF|uniref:DNA replication/repair protein RecF n=1 Tax=unclassified Butyrivibrio TaxID=2639466 RepID=UPI0003B4A02B|nr:MULTISPECIES: DNA replication/repair protein RecF [unclassified Butyrivibrio]MBE5839090.1 DNA replication/repair protein RecF [Butyrivibrio sp.]SEG36350.1 DNA replication and repair protein RecF [Butyrivibrio sp. Su6]
MIIKSLELSDFRNYENLKIDFSSGTNILYGDNAQGKTNILEAIFMSATTKSHKGSKDKEIIRFGKDEAHIRTILDRDNAEYRVDMHLRSSKTKGIAIDGQKIKRASDLIGKLNVVFFSPEDLSIIKNGPSERRRFMDMELCQLDQVYLNSLSKYNKLVVERNKVLKDLFDHPENSVLLDVQDKQLCEYGSVIIKTREKFIGDLNEIIRPIHNKLTGGKEDLSIYYEPNVDATDFEKKLSSSRQRDIYAKQTTVGPHKDDFSFIVKRNSDNSEKIDIRKFGSQGQQRTASLSLKLSEIEIVKKAKKENPVLLLDDVLSELDSNRQNYLLNTIGDIQTIITCTGLDEFVNNRFEIDKLFKVTEGTVNSEN